MTGEATEGTDSHWVRWHAAYEDPASPLTVRLGLVQDAVGRALTAAPAGPVSIISICAGQGRDVIDVLAGHPRAGDVRALLVELDPNLVAFARARATAAGVDALVTVLEGDAGRSHWYADRVPAQVVLVCGVFGNISPSDIAHTVQALPSFCADGARVIWTRHRRPPDATPHIRQVFDDAGFDEVSFEAPDGYVLSVGHHRYRGAVGESAPAFDPDLLLFEFVGDGNLPA